MYIQNNIFAIITVYTMVYCSKRCVHDAAFKKTGFKNLVSSFRVLAFRSISIALYFMYMVIINLLLYFRKQDLTSFDNISGSTTTERCLKEFLEKNKTSECSRCKF